MLARMSLSPPLLLLAFAAQAPAPKAPVGLLFDDFAGPDALAAWAPFDGAHTGVAGPASASALVDGALCLSAAADTQRWVALTRTVPLEGVAWLRVSARMRTENVERAQARFVNCNLFVRFSNGGIAGTPVLAGTQDWTPVARRLPVPAGASSATLGCFLSMPGQAWFDDVRLESVSPPAWNTEEAGALVFHWLPGDEISPDARAYSLLGVQLTNEFLGLEPSAPIQYFKYPDLATKLELTGDAGNAFAEPAARRIHTLWERDRHELVHVLAHALGRPPALLGEGLAVHLSGSWQREPIATYARRLRDEGRWVPLAELLDTGSFQRVPDLVSYAEAGAFVGWIEAEHGRETLRALYRALDGRVGVAENRQRLEQALGASLVELDEELRASL